MSLWVVEFDFRSDEGPMLVGPFPTKDKALDWLETQTGFDFSANPAPLAVPHTTKEEAE